VLLALTAYRSRSPGYVSEPSSYWEIHEHWALAVIGPCVVVLNLTLHVASHFRSFARTGNRRPSGGIFARVIQPGINSKESVRGLSFEAFCSFTNSINSTRVELVRRLFFTYTEGWPGIALLLMRIAAVNRFKTRDHRL
jgi:hypothetical protein